MLCVEPANRKRVSNQRLKTRLGYQFKYPTFRDFANGFAGPHGPARRSGAISVDGKNRL
jgi:hypothetical protein